MYQKTCLETKILEIFKEVKQIALKQNYGFALSLVRSLYLKLKIMKICQQVQSYPRVGD